MVVNLQLRTRLNDIDLFASQQVGSSFAQGTLEPFLFIFVVVVIVTLPKTQIFPHHNAPIRVSRAH